MNNSKKLTSSRFTLSEVAGKPVFLHNYETLPDFKPNTKLAIFDLDDTLTTTKSGLSFSKDRNDFKLKYASVPEKLNFIFESGFVVAIVTNQLGIGNKFIRLSDFTEKLEKLAEFVKIPMLVLVAIKNDEFRKPSIGTFMFIIYDILKLGPKVCKKGDLQLSSITFGQCSRKESRCSISGSNYSDSQKGIDEANSGIDNLSSTQGSSNVSSIFSKCKNTKFTFGLNYYLRMEAHEDFALGAKLHEHSFFCGDAAGRESLDANDFSDTDLKYAINCKLNFYLPEQIFENKIVAPLEDPPKWQFTQHLETNKDRFEKQFDVESWTSSGKPSCLVMMVGPSSSGKSTLCKTLFGKEWKMVTYVSLKDSQRKRCLQFNG